MSSSDRPSVVLPPEVSAVLEAAINARRSWNDAHSPDVEDQVRHRAHEVYMKAESQLLAAVVRWVAAEAVSDVR